MTGLLTQAWPLVGFRRGGLTESEHRGWFAVVGPDTPPSWAPTSPPVFVRSAIKPFQALPLLVTGAAEAFGLDDVEIATACSSHSGQPCHTEVVAAMLAKGDIPLSALACGVHAPLGEADAAAFSGEGRAPTVLHNNCSGKHAGFLLVCQHQGWPLAGYLDAAHPLQTLIRRLLGEVVGMAPEGFAMGTDGCSAPTFAMPIARLATGFARLARPQGRWADALTRIGRAMRAHPRQVAGDGRFDTELMTVGPFVAKVGAEAVHAGVHLPSGTAWALKVADGGRRALSIAVCGLLEGLGLIDLDGAGLMNHAAGPLHNHAGMHVGDSRFVGWPLPSA